MTAVSSKGSILIELIIAVSIWSLSIPLIASLIFSSRQLSTKLETYRQAIYMAKNNLEKELSLQQNFNSFISSAFTTSETGAGNLFSEKINIQDATPCIKLVSSLIDWQEGAVPENVTLASLITDPIYNIARDGDCEGDPILSTWSNMHVSGTVSPPIAANVKNIDTLNGIAAVSFASTTSQPGGISLFDAHDHAHPAFISNLLIPGGVIQLDLASRYIYAASDGTSSQFKIIDTQNPSLPFIVSSSTLPGVAGTYPGATSIFYYNSKVYIGTHRTAGHEFHILDVSSKTNPVWLGSIELNHNINATTVRDSYAYLATSGNIKNLIILDIHDPANIIQVSSLAFSGSEDAISEFLIGNVLFMGRKKALSASDPEFIAIDISNPAIPTIIGTLYLKTDVVSINIAENMAFLGTSDPKRSIIILDVSYPDHMNIKNSLTLNTANAFLDYENGMLYGAGGQNMYVISP